MGFTGNNLRILDADLYDGLCPDNYRDSQIYEFMLLIAIEEC